MSNQNEISPEKGPFDEPTAFRNLALEVEGRKFWVSREGLAGCSKVFEKMLYGEFAEAKQNVIPLPGKKVADVEEILKRLIPHPDVNDSGLATDLSNADLILGFAEEYQIDCLFRRATVSLTEFLNTFEKGDERLLQILDICLKYRLKEQLRRVISRCGAEFELTKLESIYEKLPSEVIACLGLYKNLTPSDNKCRYLFQGYSYPYGTCNVCGSGSVSRAMACMYCGAIRCLPGCLDAWKFEDAVCNREVVNVENSVTVLLGRLNL